MARAVRSPDRRSSLHLCHGFRPLILHPETVLEDRPRHFADYAPADFDGRFQGR
jgi:membrane carboxypeptidase/penicillin-binding protein PbpC